MDPNIENHGNQTPLDIAWSKDDFELFRLLLGHPNIDPNRKNENEWTLLQSAVADGKIALVRLCLAHLHIDPNARTHEGNTALHIAVFNEQLESLRLLLQHPQIDPNPLGAEGCTPLHAAVKKRGREAAAVDMVKVLSSHPRLDPNALTDNGYDSEETALDLAIEQKRYRVAEELIKDQRVCQWNDDGERLYPLEEAIENRDVKMLQLLLRDNVNTQLPNGRTALHNLVSWDEILTELLKRDDVDPNIQDEQGNTPLHHYLETFEDLPEQKVELFLANGKVKWDLTNRLGDTILDLAVIHQQIPVIKILLEKAGLSEALKRRALQIAKEKNLVECVQLFSQAGANPNLKDQ